MARGISLTENGRYLEAAEYFDKISDSDSTYTEAQGRMALAYYYAHKYQKAIEISKHGIEIAQGTNILFYHALANSYYYGEQFSEAALTFRKATTEYPYQADFWLMQGMANMQINKTSSAISAFQKHIELSFERPEAHFLMGHLLADVGRTTPALLSLPLTILATADTSVAKDAFLLIDQITNLKIPSQSPAAVNHLEDKVLGNLEFALETGKLDPKLTKRYRSSAAFEKYYAQIAHSLPTNSNSLNFWMRNYTPFYAGLKNKKLYRVFLKILLAKGKNDTDALKWLEKHEKDFLRFEKYYRSFVTYRASVHWEENRNNFKDVQMWKTAKGNVFAIGDQQQISDSLVKTGRWKFINGDGKVTSVGQFIEGKKDGRWKHYFPNGTLNRIVHFKNGVKTDTLRTFYTDGGLKEVIPFTNGKIDGRYQRFFKLGSVATQRNYIDGKLSGNIKIYYPNEQLKAKLHCQDGKTEGECLYYHENGQLQSRKHYSGNMLNGKITYYYPSGELKMKGEYLQNKKIGGWKWYYPDSTLMNKQSFNTSGKKEGESVSYHVNGQIEEKRFYINGQLNGSVKGFAETGEELYEYQYENGVLQSYVNLNLAGDTVAHSYAKNGVLEVSTHYPDGTLEAKGSFRNGEKHGMWNYFYSNGKLSQVRHYENGESVGEVKSYYPDGKPKSVLFYQNNMAQGKYISYFRNDSISEQGFYENNEKAGTWTSFYPNGKKKSQERYSAGVLTGYQYYFYADGLLSNRQLYSDGIMVAIDFYDIKEMKPELRRYELSDSMYTSFYPSGQKRMQSPHKQGQLEGAYQVFYPNGKLMERGTMLHGELHGKMTRFFPDGNIEAERSFGYGSHSGTWKFYNRKGLRTKEVSFENGRETYVLFNKQDQEIERYEMADGLLDGFHYIYNPYGKLICRKRYREGMLVSYAYPYKKTGFSEELPINYDSNELKVYYKNGKVAILEKFDDGYLKGTGTLFFPSGKIAKETQYKYGVKHGTEKTYYPDGTLKLECQFFYGKMNGHYIFYNRQGKPKREDYYLWGDLHGEQRLFRNGKLKETLHYTYGEFIPK